MKLRLWRFSMPITTKKEETLPLSNKKKLQNRILFLTSFSIGSTQSACSLSSFIARTLLYGEVITSSSPEG